LPLDDLIDIQFLTYRGPIFASNAEINLGIGSFYDASLHKKAMINRSA